jgi:phage gp36-like protein
MSYASQQLVQDEIGGLARLTDALDDSGTGTLDSQLMQRLLDSAAGAVDGFLQGRYFTPLSPVPAIAVEANLVFCLEKIYERRRQGPDEENPYRERANEMRKRLKRIADREESLDAQERPAFNPGAVIQEESKTRGSTL